ncbi:MAG: DUF6152 family protein [Janthinobacterium lividum]
MPSPISRRRFVFFASAGCAAPLFALPSAAWAHHGWSSFDQDRPVYLEGKVAAAKWQNPHAELMLDVSPGLTLPSGLAQRAVPAQSAGIDGPALLAKAVVPNRKDRRWELELAPLTRMSAWQVPQIKVSESVSAVGFTSKDETGEAVMRVEYLFVGGKTYGLRSSPV